MILADTSVWIEFFRGRAPVSTQLQPLLELQEICTVEWVFGELLQGAKDKREQTILLDYWKNLPKLEAEGLWVEAGVYSSGHHLFSKGVGLIDAALIVAARRSKAVVWTFDKLLLSQLHPAEIFQPSTSGQK